MISLNSLVACLLFRCPLSGSHPPRTAERSPVSHNIRRGCQIRKDMIIDQCYLALPVLFRHCVVCSPAQDPSTGPAKLLVTIVESLIN